MIILPYKDTYLRLLKRIHTSSIIEVTAEITTYIVV